MSPVLFWFFAALMLVFGALVVLNRNPVASALSLVVCFLCLAALFVRSTLISSPSSRCWSMRARSWCFFFSSSCCWI